MLHAWAGQNQGGPAAAGYLSPSVVEAYPFLLVWLGHSEPHVECTGRKAIARQVLQTQDKDLEANAARVKIQFRTDLEEAARTGRTGYKLYAFARVLAASMECSVQPNEGMNSLIKRLVERARNIGLPLLSSRACVKRFLGLGISNAVHRWSQENQSKSYLLVGWFRSIFGCSSLSPLWM